MGCIIGEYGKVQVGVLGSANTPNRCGRDVARDVREPDLRCTARRLNLFARVQACMQIIKLLFSAPWSPQGVNTKWAINSVGDLRGIKWLAYGPGTAKIA